MVDKSFCDVCGAEIPSFYDEFGHRGGHFVYKGKGFDLCEYCAGRVRRMIEELKETYTVMGMLKGKFADLKGQKELSDFE